MRDRGKAAGSGSAGERARDRGVECLKGRALRIEAEAAFLRRHEEIVEWAGAELGVERAFAERIYEIAIEEGVEPAFAFELVRCGVGIVEASGGEADAPSLQTTPPAWVSERPDPDEAPREWRLRTSVRRLAALLNDGRAPAEALREFAASPDIDAVAY